ncbi:Outer membrane protein SusF domain-containing protein [Segatella copri]|uniref:Outer membrane protein SusF domain-containing protein n=1 Tax=Segatella copri TaxID=165179 RepID=UPI003F710000
MIKKILLGMTLLMSMVSCTEDYTDWANPQTNPEEEAVSFGNGSVTPEGVINLADVTGDKVKVASIVAPTSTKDTYTPSFKINFDGQSFDIDADGNMAKADLVNYITGKYGKRPKERDIDATLDAWLSNGSTAAKMATSETFQVKAIPEAPFIDAAYYLVGDLTEWGLDTKLKFAHSDADVYEDPVFTLMFTTTKDDQCWKIIPQGNVDKGNIWAVENAPEGVVGIEEDGDKAMSGKLLTTNSQGKKAGAGKIAKAGIYQMTINMMDYTYTIKQIAPEYYLVGKLQGWASEPKDKTCLMYAETPMVQSYTTQWNDDANLKIWLGSDWGDWNNAYGSATMADANTPTGKLKVDNNAGAIICPEPGAYYTFTADFSTMTYKWTKLANQNPTEFEYVALIGVGGKWSNGDDIDDIDLKQVAPHNWYKANVKIPAGGLKIRADHKWRDDGNWGFAEGQNYESKGTLITSGGSNNIPVPAGTYNIYFNDITGAYAFVEVK